MSAYVFPLELENLFAKFDCPEGLDLDFTEMVNVRSNALDVSDDSGVQVMTRQ